MHARAVHPPSGSPFSSPSNDQAFTCGPREGTSREPAAATACWTARRRARFVCDRAGDGVMLALGTHGRVLLRDPPPVLPTLWRRSRIDSWVFAPQFKMAG